jgi:hypothetical protein
MLLLSLIKMFESRSPVGERELTECVEPEHIYS